ncbi:InlB B-repeat-containing protein [Paenibacillus contaminans]|uniref:DUF11 domain-containing protein n=1 Tax=Paenibacillus contaminans TaxID=450362 RepID=A0A329MCQ4_9BACL|nr:InlB B-repeat-containing protein [Paenibacillus contaminans]RAV17761.1 hypothetical protein DQG23_26960 [Paenibacillus contaminans]
MIGRKWLLSFMIVIGAVLFGILGPPDIAKAEGSKEMVANGGYRPFIWATTDKTAGIERKTYLKVYAQAGEKIYLGSSQKGKNIIFTDPNGVKTSYQVDQNGVGYIDTLAKETKGPSLTTDDGGYVPYIVSIAQTGIYQVEFEGGTAAPSTTLTTDTSFRQNQGGTIGAWDITIVDANGDKKPGRVFTSYVAMYMGGNKPNQKVLNSVFYVVTKDGYLYKTDMNGLDPNGFIFFSANRGFIDLTNNMTLYHTADGNDDNLSVISGNVGAQLPNVADTNTDISHYVFFNPPSPDLPVSLYPGATAPVPAKPTALAFQGASGIAGKTNLADGGTFTFVADKPSSYELTIKTKDAVPVTKRVIKNVAIAGTNKVLWDGKDSAGNVLPDQVYTAELILRSGEVHFPLLDAEHNTYGIKVELLNAPDGNSHTTIYYDESNYKTASGTSINLNASSSSYAINPVDASAGVDSANGAHKWSNNYGDKRGIDTWTYFTDGTSITIDFNVEPVSATKYGSLSGYIFNDMNKDTKFSSGEPGLNGITVTVKDKNGTDHTTTTDATGYYIVGIPQGNYTFKATAPTGYTLQTGNGTQTGTLSASSVILQNVGYYLETDLKITVTASSGPYIKGSTFTYTLNASNVSNVPATRVVVNDALPAGLTYVSDDSSGDYDASTGIWTIGTLSSGQSVTMNITVRINSDAGVPASITNQAVISSTEKDSDLTNNSSSLPISVTNSYTVTFNSNSGSAVPAQTVNENDKATEPTAPTKSGFTFNGWFTDSNFDPATAFDFNTPITAPITLYAKWTAITHTVTFDSNGGSAVPVQTVNENDKASEPTAPTKAGFTFDGWFTDSNFDPTTAFNFNTPITAPITLYAKWTPVTHTVTFVSNGGSAVPVQTVNKNDKASEPTVPTKGGFTFDGWFTNSNLDPLTAFDFNTSITAPITLYAKWTPVTHTVTFVSNGGSAVPTQTVNENDKATEPTVPTKSGFTFDGWLTDSNDPTTAFNFNTPITAPVTLYAKWTAITHTVTFNTYGGSAVPTQIVNENDKASEPSAPTKAGFTFDNWFTNSNLDPATAFNFNTPITAPVTLYAKWTAVTHTVTFNTYGGSAVPTQIVIENDKASEPSVPTKAGFIFDGWYTNDNLDPATAFDFNTPITAPVTLYAKWTAVTHTVTFNTYGGSAVPTQIVIENDKASEPSVPTKAGFIFDGWYTNDNLDPATAFDFNTPITAPVTLYAKWTEIAPNTHAVIFNSNGGSPVPAQIVNENDKAAQPAAPAKTGFIFDGWYANDNLDPATAFDFNTPITAPVTLYAKWTAIVHTVTFESNGGSAVPTQTVNENDKATQPAAPAKTGFTFDGWFTSVNLDPTTAFDFNTPITAPVTLYAKWTSIPTTTVPVPETPAPVSPLQRLCRFRKHLHQFRRR